MQHEEEIATSKKRKCHQDEDTEYSTFERPRNDSERSIPSLEAVHAGCRNEENLTKLLNMIPIALNFCKQMTRDMVIRRNYVVAFIDWMMNQSIEVSYKKLTRRRLLYINKHENGDLMLLLRRSERPQDEIIFDLKLRETDKQLVDVKCLTTWAKNYLKNFMNSRYRWYKKESMDLQLVDIALQHLTGRTRIELRSDKFKFMTSADILDFKTMYLDQISDSDDEVGSYQNIEAEDLNDEWYTLCTYPLKSIHSFKTLIDGQTVQAVIEKFRKDLKSPQLRNSPPNYIPKTDNFKCIELYEEIHKHAFPAQGFRSTYLCELWRQQLEKKVLKNDHFWLKISSRYLNLGTMEKMKRFGGFFPETATMMSKPGVTII
jgi:hypothetical protein